MSGMCYRDSYLFFMKLRHDGQSAGWRLCHGFPRLTREPRPRYGHAWLELKGRFVYEPGWTVLGPRADYYRLGEIEEQHVKRYTAEEAEAQFLIFEHYGCWPPDDLPYPEVAFVGKVVVSKSNEATG